MSANPNTPELVRGVLVDHVEVSDGYEHYPGRREATRTLEEVDAWLAAHPGVSLGPGDEGHDRVFGSEAARAWKRMIPSAMALYCLQRPGVDFLPDGTPNDPGFRTFLAHSGDAIGVRTRAAVLRDLVSEHAETVAPRERASWLSLACGAAVPVTEAAAGSAATIDLTVVDIDQAALDFAIGVTAEASSIGTTRSLNRNLLRGLFGSAPLVEELGEGSYDLVEMMGIFEYFDRRKAVTAVRAARRLVRDDGLFVVGNMLDTSPSYRVNQRVAGWPGLYPRSLDELVSVLVEGGVRPEDAVVRVPSDGVYAVAAVSGNRSTR